MGSAAAVPCVSGGRLGGFSPCPQCKQLRKATPYQSISTPGPVLSRLSWPESSQAGFHSEASLSGKASYAHLGLTGTFLCNGRLESLLGRSPLRIFKGLAAFVPARKGARRSSGHGRQHWRIQAAAGSSEGKDFYEILMVPQTADEREIKKAYRRMALKYHPDVNKEKDAEAVFVKIKQAYTTLSDPKTRSQYDAQLRGGAWGFPGGSPDWDPTDPFGYKKKRAKGGKQEEEEFYGLGDFFRDLQKEVEGWQNDRQKGSSQAPKSLWEELSEVGEEFVEFLEQELGIDEKESKQRTDQRKGSGTATNSSRQESAQKAKERSGPKSTDGVAAGRPEKQDKEKEEGADIEELLASLKKEMGL